ncbi:MAG: type I restriction endonuclease subunit R [Eubacterium sp.]|nr:type I restriction endonuclease subunit R [Eubacterium sp.]
MPNYITEDDIELAILQKLKAKPFCYDVIICDADTAKRDDLNDGTGRSSKKQCVLPEVLLRSILRINPDIDRGILENIAKDLSRDFTSSDMTDVNYRNYKKIRDKIQVKVRRNGKEDFDFVQLVDFEHPENNTFTAVSQMWIQGHYRYRRPDVLIFVNGLPFVFIELKNSIVKIEEAYNKNLLNYKKDVPNLFAFNQICVLSNGLETRLGAFNASYDFFFEWLKVESEKESINRDEIKNDGVSAERFVDGLLNKERLIDYIENFIVFDNQRTKIIAKNHQFFGVNNLIESVHNRKELAGKLGVFWHTQGSGKSYSMVMFARKVRRKIEGNFTFLVITDREDLDAQIHKNFVRTEVIGDKEECQPKNGKQLREYLQSNKGFIFTLIHKFRYDKDKKYPVLSERDDIIVMVDEAHRTQYKDLAENMRTAIPNANFIAFTGTPLLGSKRLTNQWFGDYVSEYNFAQSVEDGSTVPLFYSRRVPEVGLKNNFLDDDIVEVIEDENLNDEEVKKLENSGSRILEVIKREDRLDKIAQDIAHHFPRRGFLGKGLVVSVDKYTAVKMYDKVQHYWQEEIKALMQERNEATTPEEIVRLSNIIEYMQTTEMAVVISEENGEDEKFSKLGLDIAKHRDKMKEITPEGLDIEDRFKTPYDSLRLVFVCAMWLTGFDVKNLSTVYLDKPMKSHTLMQAIARANRVFPGKPCGIIVDYVNVFKWMRQALSDYATSDGTDDYPAKNIDMLVDLLNQSIDEGDNFLKGIGYDLEALNASGTFDRIRVFNDIIARDDTKEKFKVITNTMVNLYEASKPEIFEMGWSNDKFGPLKYLHDLFKNNVDDDKINRAKARMADILDYSVISEKTEDNDNPEYVIHGTKVIDLSKIDTDELRKEIKKATYKAIEIDDLKAYLEKALEQMINKNTTRVKFSERFKGIIDRYNAGGSENEDYYEQLLQLIEDLKNESSRANFEGLNEEELELYDLLIKGKKLTKAQEQAVKLAAKELFKKLTSEKTDLLVVDWYKDERPKARVRNAIADSLDSFLPDCYDKDSFDAKTNLLLNHFIDMSIQGYGWIVA